MPTLLPFFNWGGLRVSNPELNRQLSEAYTSTAQIVNGKVSKYVTDRDAPNPATADQANQQLDIGDVWVNSSTNAAWMMTSRTTDLLVTWKPIT